MTCRLVIQPEAESDLDEAYRWYENQRSGLGREFITCVEAVFKRICETPELHPIVHNSVRQTLLKRFPYVVCYVFAEDCVDVVAVFHGHRKPTAWQSRMD